MRLVIGRGKRAESINIPFVSPRPPGRPYEMKREGYTFSIDGDNVKRLKSLPDFENKEEPALAEDFLRFRVEGWAENLADAGADPGDVSVSVDPHQRKAHLVRGSVTLFSADI
jgi:hypothetical protein